MQVLITEEQIRHKVAELGQRVTDDFRGRPLTVLGVLKGSLVLLADLIRQIELPHRVGLIQASSYRGSATSPGELRISREILPEIRGRDVLLLDDIFDTGRTLAAVLDLLREFEPRSLKSAVLLWKEGRQEVAIQPDYYGFRIPNVFVVGYGLDFNDDYRHLPYVGVLD